MQYYMLNKPRGLITARKDESKPTVMECFPKELRDILHPVGRLDLDTEGILLFADDGKLDQEVIRPEKNVKKEYEFYAFGIIDENAKAMLENGVLLTDGKTVSKPAEAEVIQYITIGDSIDYLPEDKKEHFLKNPDRPVTVGKLWITEGKRHQIKLMVKAVGCHVFYLKRLAIGPLRLDSSLLPGEYRKLTSEEIDLLISQAKD